MEDGLMNIFTNHSTFRMFKGLSSLQGDALIPKVLVFFNKIASNLLL